jgi:hypothetical protein
MTEGFHNDLARARPCRLFILEFPFNGRKKLDPFKSFILQPPGLRKLAFRKGCKMNDLNGPNFKKIP